MLWKMMAIATGLNGKASTMTIDSILYRLGRRWRDYDCYHNSIRRDDGDTLLVSKSAVRVMPPADANV